MCMVSVIVPVYGVESYLPRCIDSILSQSYTDFELILVDDESPDSCGRICDDYARTDPRLKVIHQKNSGVSRARNAALDIASGQYIAFCDSDDFWDQEYLKRMIDEIQRTKADVVSCNYTVIDEMGDRCGTSTYPAGEETIGDLEARFDYLVCGILSGYRGWAIWTRLFRADIIHTHHIRFCPTCENYAEDLGFVFQFCCYADKLCSIHDPLYFYMTRQGSMMDSSKQILKLDQMNELSKFLHPLFRNTFSRHKVRRCFPMIHFMLMCPEYKKIACTPEYATLGQHSRSITDSKWYRSQLKKFPRCYRMLKHCFGLNLAKRSLLLASYAYHGSWKRFTVESAITYKWLVNDSN